MSSPSWSPESLKILRGVGDPGKYVWSAFVNKLEARLRFDGLTYIGEGSPLTAPRGKIPYIELREAKNDSSGKATDTKTTIMSDSTLIIRELVSSGHLRDRDAVLTPAQRAHDLATRALLEDRVYFYGIREKWCDNYQEMVDNVLQQVHWPLRPLVG